MLVYQRVPSNKLIYQKSTRNVDHVPIGTDWISPVFSMEFWRVFWEWDY
jgi:hypothetical protein